MEKIRQNDNGTVTVTNERIAVTTSKNDFIKYGRAVILSDAMRQLGNASELRLINKEAITEDEVRTKAYTILFFEYLKEHTSYPLHIVLARYYSHAKMSKGMQAQVDEANMFASGVLNPIPAEELEKRLLRLDDNYHPREIKKLRLLANMDKYNIDDVLRRARAAIAEFKALEKSYRNHFAHFRNHWVIQIIGPMPEIIGTCRFISDSKED